jgi:hypothetical protein
MDGSSHGFRVEAALRRDEHVAVVGGRPLDLLDRVAHRAGRARQLVGERRFNLSDHHQQSSAVPTTSAADTGTTTTQIGLGSWGRVSIL